LQTLLQIKDLSIDFITENGVIPAIKDLSLSIDRGEILAIVGESGSGKSVTALSILQLLPPTANYKSGEIIFFENNGHTNLLSQSFKQIQQVRGNKIAIIFQEPMTSLNPVFSCGEQVTETIVANKKISRAQAKELTIRLFEKVKLPHASDIYHRFPHQLSGGQKQRVMIAIALSCNPSLLICDEPTTALDVTVQKSILELIKEIQQAEKIGVIFITHDLGLVAEIADRAVVMLKGKIVEQGNVNVIFNKPQHPYTKALMNCRPTMHKKGERLPVVSDFTGVEIDYKELRSGDEQYKSKIPNQSVNQSGIPLIRVQDLSVWFPARKNFLGKILTNTKAIDEISFEVYKGETLGLVGESGCGKTTLGRTLLRLVQPTSGKILFEGKDMAEFDSGELKRMRKNIQIVFQDPYSSLNPRLTIGSAIEEPLIVHKILSSAKERREKVEELLGDVDLKPEHFERYPHEFSGGQRQRIVIARALALNPSFIVCDESVSALDVSVQSQILNLLTDLKKQLGFTVIFISHDLSVVHYLSDRIMVMHKGKIVETGTAEEIYFHPQKDYTKKLIAAIPTI